MEASSSQVPLTIESFSYSNWLVNNMRSSFEISCGNSFRTSLDEASFIEMDPTMPPSKRFYFTTTTTTTTNYSSRRSSHDFKFPALSLSPSSFPLIHADRLISNGYLVPLQAYEGGAMIGSPDMNLESEAAGKSGSLRWKGCRRISRQILEKYLNFLRPICRRIQRVGGGGGNYGINIGIKLGTGKKNKLLFQSGTTTRSEPHHHQSCFDEWRRSSCDSETSVYDAVLHCKNSIGK